MYSQIACQDGLDPVFSKGQDVSILESIHRTSNCFTPQINSSMITTNKNTRIQTSVCVFVCVFLQDNSNRNQSRNTKFEYIVVYENSSDEFNIELRRIKDKVTVGVQKFSPFTIIQTVRSYSSNLVPSRNLILGMYLHLILIYKIYEYRQSIESA